MAGIANKCEETWEYLEKFDIIGLTKTWAEGAWKRIGKKVSKRFEWNCIPAIKENIKGRAKGGIITAINKNMKERIVKELNKGAMEIKFTHNKNRWRIVTIYSQDMKETMEKLKKEIEEDKKGFLIIGRDFNARTGEGGPIETRQKNENVGRKSKDKIINREGKIMLNKINERGWIILNSSYEKEGNWTYIRETGSSVIDYIVGNEKATEEIKRVEEGNRTESDHVPLEVELEGTMEEEKGRSGIVWMEKSVWTSEGMEQYHKKCEGWTCTKIEKEEVWRELREKLKESGGRK